MLGVPSGGREGRDAAVRCRLAAMPALPTSAQGSRKGVGPDCLR
jgi:hypothetical protein